MTATANNNDNVKASTATATTPITPLVTLTATPTGRNCPFGNAVSFSLVPGGCVWLQGASGRGKTTLAMTLAGLRTPDVSLQTNVQIEWNETIPVRERCGVLFQQTTLLDELTLAGNVALALQHNSDSNDNNSTTKNDIKHLLDTVGLDYARDAHKRVSELSGGMARRASLALPLAQSKRVLVLDEPLAGLDHDAAVAVAKALVELRRSARHVALVLIAHERDVAERILDPACPGNVRVVLTQQTKVAKEDSLSDPTRAPSLHGIRWSERFRDRLIDYGLYSLPLILLTFLACGLAISMLTADTLGRMDVTNQVVSMVDQEVRPLLKLLTGNDEPNALHMMGIRYKVRQLLDDTVPPAKAALYARGLAQLLVLEIGPLLTALLLCGRIGGSYAGRVATLHATAQTALLKTLGVYSTRSWTWGPSAAAAVLAGPALTVAGTALAVGVAGVVGSSRQYHTSIGLTSSEYWNKVWDTVCPPSRLRGMIVVAATTTNENGGNVNGESSSMLSSWWALLQNPDLRTTFSDSYGDTLIEILTYPAIFHLLKAVTFSIIVIGVADLCCAYSSSQSQQQLNLRQVPGVITSSVVTGSLVVILADWGFSRLWLLRH